MCRYRSMQTKYTTSVCWTFCISLCPPFIKSLQPWIHILQDKFRVLCLSFHLTQWYWIELLCYEIVSYSAALVPRVLPFFKPINFSDISKKLYMISAFSHLLLKGLTFVRCILQGAGENCFHLECDNFSLHSPLNVNYQVLTTCYWFWPEGYRDLTADSWLHKQLRYDTAQNLYAVHMQSSYLLQF